jgi:hypothetical protein
MKDIEATVKERKKQMKKSAELLDGIIADGAISDTHLRMLVDEIVIYEKNGKLDIQITPNGEFRTHIDYYDESGDITDRHAEIYGISRIGKVWRRANPPPYHISIFFCAVNITDSQAHSFMLCARFLACDK